MTRQQQLFKLAAQLHELTTEEEREQKVYGVGWVWAVERLEREAER